MRKPYWRSQTQYWYLDVHGKQVRLSRLGEQDADGATRKDPPPAVQNEWHRIMREGTPEDMRLGDLISAYIASLPEDSDNRTTSKRQLARFEKHVGKEIKVSLLKPLKLTEYLRTNPTWKPSSVRTFVNRLHACLNWGVRQGLLDKNPISSTPGYKREGRNERRRGVISDADHKKAVDFAGEDFRAVLTALRETGARPSEIMRAQIDKVNLEQSCFAVPNKTAHQTGEAERTIYLSPVGKRLFVDVIGDRTEGHVFLNSRGMPWTIQALKKRWEVLRAKTGVTGSLRTYRRTFASKAINDTNVNPALVALLLGHADLTMLLKHYLEENPTALRKAVDQITAPRSSAPPKTDSGRRRR
jgi:integrase